MKSDEVIAQDWNDPLPKAPETLKKERAISKAITKALANNNQIIDNAIGFKPVTDGDFSSNNRDQQERWQDFININEVSTMIEEVAQPLDERIKPLEAENLSFRGQIAMINKELRSLRLETR